MGKENGKEMKVSNASQVAEEPPLSPAGKLFHSPRFNCCIIAVVGCKIKIDPSAIVDGLKHTLINHPRFSSKLVNHDGKEGRPRWMRTTVKVEDHVITPDLDPEMGDTDRFLEDYVSKLSTIPMDTSKPLWEIHLLNVKTSEAEATGVLRLHHSLGDGISIMSLVIACTRQSSDPQALPSLPVQKRHSNNFRPQLRGNKVWLLVWTVLSFMRLVFNTCVDVMAFVATLLFLKDSKTALKGGCRTELNPRRFVHRTVSLDDIKLVKNAMKMTINDVILGVTQAALSRYLNRKHGRDQDSKRFLGGVRLRGAVVINLRPTTEIKDLADMMAKRSSCRWGNWIGYVLLPFSIAPQSDPLDYVRKAKATIDRKKLSLEAVFSFASFRFLINWMGVKAGAANVRRIFSNTTMTFSNVVGPVEEVSFYGHPMVYCAPTVCGHPHALSIHFASYMNKMTMSLAVDPAVIQDPHQLCDDLEESLKTIKAAVLAKELPKNST